MRRLSAATWLGVTALVVGACAPVGRDSRSATAAGGQAPNRTLVIGIHVEPTTLAGRPITTSGATPDAPTLLFNAWLAVNDGHGAPRPQLATSLPQLNTADWQVFPDGQMETTYRLRPGLVWHDGAPITAADVVFGWQVFSWPAMGVPSDPPIGLIQEITAPDLATVLIRWKKPYPDAGAVGSGRYGGVPPMPRHLLEAKFLAGDAQAFLNDPYWTTQFVGSGPYRPDQWEPGSYIQASAFADFVEGKPQIDQIKLVFLSDPDAAAVNLESGGVHLLAEEAIGLQQGSVLRRQWEASGSGSVILTPNKSRFLQVQFKAAYVSPSALLDSRVRRALLEATDRATLSEAILEGQAAIADTIAGPVEEYFADLDRAITKYPFDLTEANVLLGQAGYTKQADGSLIDASGQRLALELRAFAADPGPREAAILADQWKTFGVQATIHIIAAAQSQDLEQVSAYPALRIEQTGLTGTIPITKLAGTAVATPENRWAGVNRGGWVNPDYDRFTATFISSLNRAERNRAAVQAFQVASQQLPVLPLYYLSLAAAYVSALKGPVGGYTGDLAWDNVREWDWVR